MRIASELDDLAHGQRFDRDTLRQHDAEPTSQLGMRDRREDRRRPSSTLPQSGGCILAIVRNSVDLPMPFGPSRQTSSPESHREVDVLEHGAARSSRTVADGQIARAERGIERGHPANAPRRLRSRTATTTGAPMKRGHRIERQHAAHRRAAARRSAPSSATALPISTTAGTSTR